MNPIKLKKTNSPATATTQQKTACLIPFLLLLFICLSPPSLSGKPQIKATAQHSTNTTKSRSSAIETYKDSSIQNIGIFETGTKGQL